MSSRLKKVHLSRIALIGVGAIAIFAMTGCYQRTIGARGIGAASHEVSAPYQESGRVDDWIFGPTDSGRKMTPMTRNNSTMR